MSLQTDAQDCLLEAVANRNGVDVPPEKMGDVKPSDGEIGAQNGLAWQLTLEDAASRLRGRDYDTREPALDKANILVNKVLAASQAYLEELSRPSKSATGQFLLWGGGAAAAGVLAAIIHHLSQRRS
ncbi:MAG TPA: hypothetical protein VF503_29585 [Sphingobium sp.]|uniref:hypothetical protein n=1 Tax=Sphingobium sp. TaxID=1912891 RepID=UPI002ED2332F